MVMKYLLKDKEIHLIICPGDAEKLEKIIPASFKTKNGIKLYLVYFPDQIGDFKSWARKRRHLEFEYAPGAQNVVLLLCRNTIKHQIFIQQKVIVPSDIPLYEDEIFIRRECNEIVMSNS